MDKNYIQGIGGSKFGLGEQISCEQPETFFCSYAKSMGKDTDDVIDLSVYIDSDMISSRADRSVAWAVKSGLISGTSKEEMYLPKAVAIGTQAARIFILYDKMK